MYTARKKYIIFFLKNLVSFKAKCSSNSCMEIVLDYAVAGVYYKIPYKDRKLPQTRPQMIQISFCHKWMTFFGK